MVTLTANEELHDALVRHQTYLLRYSGYVRNRIQAILDATEQDIFDKIVGRLQNAPGGLTSPVEVQRMQALQDQIATIRSGAWDDATADFKDQMTQLSVQESVTFGKIVTLALPVEIQVVQPSARLLRSIALSKPFQGRILKDWAADMESDDLRRINNAIQVGMTQGEDMNTIARRVIGTGALNYRDGVTEMTRSNIQAITRTAVMHIANSSRSAWSQDNTDVMTTERFVATLDSRTTPICQSLDGQEFPIGTGPQPPLHFNCRSLRIPVIDGTLAGDRPAKPYTEEQLVGEFSDENDLGDDITSRDDLPYGTKGDYDDFAKGRIAQLVGPVPAETTYQTWLTGQSAAFQDDVLGQTKGKLFRDGDLKLTAFVNRNGDELSLHDLAAKYGSAFEAAGLDPTDY